MALRPGPKQTFTNVTAPTASSTVVALVKNCFGARAILLRMTGGSSGNVVTVTLAGNHTATGTPPSVNALAGYGISVVGSGSTNGAEGLMVTGLANSASANIPFTNILCNAVRVALQAATADVTGILLEAWPVFESFHPNDTAYVPVNVLN